MDSPQFDQLFVQQGEATAKVTVIVPVYNYGHYLPEAMDSVARQTLRLLDLVIVDDCSTDDSREIALGWISNHRERFCQITLAKHENNSGLSASRNTAFGIATTPFVFPIDPDNTIYPRCIARCLEALDGSDAAFAYTMLERFQSDTGEPDQSSGIAGIEDWSPELLAQGNYIDAMALIRKSAWQVVDGYRTMRYGWEDYDFWCKFVEAGFRGIHIPEMLGRYRVHGTSMIHRSTGTHQFEVKMQMKANHSWLNL